MESVKKAEDGDEMIIRLYECKGTSATAELKLNFPVVSVRTADLMENADGGYTLDTTRPQLRFKPFEIQTLRCRLR